MSIVEEIRTLALDSSAPEAVDILQSMEEHLSQPERVGYISAFATALVVEGTLSVEDANVLIIEATDPRLGDEWEKLANDADHEELETEELDYDMVC